MRHDRMDTLPDYAAALDFWIAVGLVATIGACCLGWI